MKQSYGGNGENANCTFPFKYNGQEITSCLDVEEVSGQKWCSTTSDFDKDQKKGFCATKGSHPFAFYIFSFHFCVQY